MYVFISFAGIGCRIFQFYFIWVSFFHFYRFFIDETNKTKSNYIQLLVNNNNNKQQQ